MYNRCHQPLLSPSTENLNHTRTKFYAVGVVNKSEPDNLLDRMVANPCLEIEYNGYIIARSTRIMIYGTCNLERMFRFALEKTHSSSNCWSMQLKAWDPAENEHCKQLPTAGTYTVHWSTLMESLIRLGSTNKSLIENFSRRTVWLRFLGTFVHDEAHYKTYEPELIAINLSDCTCCQEERHSETEIVGLHYSETWNAHCEQRREQQPGLIMPRAEAIGRLYMAIVGIVALVILAMVSFGFTNLM